MPLGLFGFCLYNEDMNGGGTNDENRGHQGFFQEGSFARRHRRATVLHFQIRLHKRWRAGSSLALDTLRPALRYPSDVRLDRAGWLFGNCPSAISAKLCYRRSNWRFCPRLASAGGSMVCISRYLPDNCRIHTMIYMVKHNI